MTDQQHTYQPNGEDCPRCSLLNLPYPFICQCPPSCSDAAKETEPNNSCGEECSEGHIYEGRCAQSTGNACVWPDCLTDGQQAELAAQVLAAEHGEETAVGPDQRLICGCDEAPRPDTASQSRTAPDNPAASGDLPNGRPRCRRCHLPHDLDGWPDDLCRNLTEELAQAAIPTPGCDCGHDGMGLRWHARDCAWLVDTEFALPANPGPFLDPPAQRRATPRNPPDLRDQLADVFKSKGGKLPTWTLGGADTIGALVDELLAVVDAALPDRAQAAIRELQRQVEVRDAAIGRVRDLLADPDNSWQIEPADLRAALETEAPDA